MMNLMRGQVCSPLWLTGCIPLAAASHYAAPSRSTVRSGAGVACRPHLHAVVDAAPVVGQHLGGHVVHRPRPRGRGTVLQRLGIPAGRGGKGGSPAAAERAARGVAARSAQAAKRRACQPCMLPQLHTADGAESKWDKGAGRARHAGTPPEPSPKVAELDHRGLALDPQQQRVLRGRQGPGPHSVSPHGAHACFGPMHCCSAGGGYCSCPRLGLPGCRRPCARLGLDVPVHHPHTVAVVHRQDLRHRVRGGSAGAQLGS